MAIISASLAHVCPVLLFGLSIAGPWLFCQAMLSSNTVLQSMAQKEVDDSRLSWLTADSDVDMDRISQKVDNDADADSKYAKSLERSARLLDLIQTALTQLKAERAIQAHVPRRTIFKKGGCNGLACAKCRFKFYRLKPMCQRCAYCGQIPGR
eukprot:scpid79959/ scgid14265/ 